MSKRNRPRLCTVVIVSAAVMIAVGASVVTSPNAKLPVEVKSIKLCWHTDAEGRGYQEVILSWKNTNRFPVRHVEAIIYDGAERRDMASRIPRVLYSVPDTSPGVQPGEIYTHPRGNGITLPRYRGMPAFYRAESVEIESLKVRQWSGY